MDDLLDLNWSAPSSTSASSASKPISPNPLPANGSKPAGSQFDFLAKSSTSGTSSPNYYNASSSTPRSSTPLTKPATSAPIGPSAAKQAPTTSNGGNDAFSSLLGMGASAGSAKTMTLAQKQAQMEDEKKRKEEHEKQQFAGLGNWEQLGSAVKPTTTGSSRSPAPPLQPIPTKPATSFDALLHPTSRPSSSAGRASPHPQPQPQPSTIKSALWDDNDDNDDFMIASSSKPSKAAQTAVSPQPDDPWDFDQLAAAKPKQSANGQRDGVPSSGGGGGSGMRTPDPNFDFGEWREEDEEERGIMSSSRSSPEPFEPRDQRSTSARATQDRPRPSARAASPPPHVVGQIVEMGFSPAQARQALAGTPTGLDVQSALDALLAQAFQGKQGRDRNDELGEADDDYVERERIRREEEEKERRRRRRQGPSRETVKPRAPGEREADRQGSGAGTPIQADQILAQASEIGQNMFTRATNLWNTGKERAMKAYEEQRKVYEAQAAESSKRGKPKDGRPRWMVEAEDGPGGPDVGGPASSSRPAAAGGFRDDHDDEELHAPDRRPARPPQSRANGHDGEPRQRRPVEPPFDRYISTKERADLLSAEEPKKYVSPARHRKPPPESSRPSRPAMPAPPPPPARTLVPADPSALQASAGHKARGNEHFKLGRFTEAESAYSAGIRELPDGHLYLIPLYNNRAATRIKLGESNGAAEDCSTVITIIGPAYHPSKEAPLPQEMATEVKLAESLVKAMTKRAQAWEMSEKWSKAVEDWERVMGFDAAILGSSASTTRNLAAEGLRRSKRMLDGNSAAGPRPSAAPAPKRPIRTATPVSKPSNVNDSEAVATLRAAAKAVEAEDQQRLQLKDSVEARLNTWKGGKETNLRALLASLDTVLWDEVLAGGLKVGMHELIAEKQVKIKYMKVIARLHPDKLDVNKTTVEQRMLANGAFGTLNEAWQAFNNA